MSGGWTHRIREVITCPRFRRKLPSTSIWPGSAPGVGVNVLSLIATLREEGRLPIRSVQWYLDTVHQLRLSVGAIVSAIHRTAQRAQPAGAASLDRWTARIGLGEQLVTTKTLRRRFFSLAGRLTRSARRLNFHLSQGWPWQNQFNSTLARLRTLPDGGNQPPDPPSGPRNIPANSHQLGPRRALIAHRLPNYARHGHCGPPESCRCGYLTPPASPSVGIGPAPFAFPGPSSLVSTPAPIASVDSG